jgi:hypothetical protein
MVFDRGDTEQRRRVAEILAIVNNKRTGKRKDRGV